MKYIVSFCVLLISFGCSTVEEIAPENSLSTLETSRVPILEKEVAEEVSAVEEKILEPIIEKNILAETKPKEGDQPLLISEEEEVLPDLTSMVEYSSLSQIKTSRHPGEQVTGGYISNYTQWIEASYPAGEDNNTLSREAANRLQSEVLALLNQKRKEAGKPSYVSNSILQSVSQHFAEHLVLNGFYSHADKYGKDPFVRTKEAGFDGFVVESMVWGVSEPSSALAWWERSDLHWGNIMNDRFTHAGIGLAKEPTGGYIIILVTGE